MLQYFQKKLKIGIIGCGAIGTILAKAIDRDLKGAKIVALSDQDLGRANALSSQLRSRPKVLDGKGLIRKSDLVIEAASGKIVAEIAARTFAMKKDLMCMSVGGFIGNEHLIEVAKKRNCNLYFPSGAIAGLDAVKAAKVGKITKVTLVTTKPPKSLSGYENAKKKKVVFEGNVTQAVKLFPQNINVSAALSLAGIGAKKTKVKIIVDPSVKVNSHEIIVEGDFGKISTKTENKPSPINPKTSYLAILSAIAMVKRIVGNVEIGS